MNWAKLSAELNYDFRFYQYMMVKLPADKKLKNTYTVKSCINDFKYLSYVITPKNF